MFSQQQNSRNDFLHGSTPNSDYLRRGGASQHPPARNVPPQMPPMSTDFGQFQSTANRNAGGFDNYGASTSILNNQSINSLLSGATNSGYGDISLAGKTLAELTTMLGGTGTGSGSAAGGGFGSRANDLSSALSNMSFQSDGMNSAVGGGSGGGGGGSKFSRPIGAERHRGNVGVPPSNSMMRHPPPSMAPAPGGGGNSPWDGGALYGDSSAVAPPPGNDLVNGFGSAGFASLAGHTLDNLINGDYGSAGGSPAVGMSPNVTPSKEAGGGGGAGGYGDYLAMQQQSGGKKIHPVPGGMAGYGDPTSVRKNMAS